MILFVNENKGILFIHYAVAVVDWFKEIFTQVSTITVKKIQESNLWKS